MQKKRNAKKRNTVKMAKQYSHGTILFSYSFLRPFIRITVVTITPIAPNIENSEHTINVFRTVKNEIIIQITIV